MENFIQQYNDQFSYPKYVYRETTQDHNTLYEGIITEVTEENRIGCNYNVRLLDWDIVLRGCKSAIGQSGYSGIGNYSSLEEGTPVLILCKQGFMADSVIVGTTHNEGNYRKFYEEGQLQRPGELEEDKLFNQPSPYPSRITQTRATTNLYKASNILEAYNSPEFYSKKEKQKQSEAHGYPGVVHGISPYGYEFNYSLGSQIYYSDGNIISASVGSKQTKTSQATKIAATHNRHAELLEGRTETEQTADINTQGLTPLVSQQRRASSTFQATDSYRAEQHRLLAGIYQKAAQEINAQAAGRYEKAKNIQSKLGTEFPVQASTSSSGSSNSSIAGANGTRTFSNYSPPNERSAFVNPNNFGDRNTEGNTQEPVVVLHETVVSLDTTKDLFSRPDTEASYHAAIDTDGSITYFTPSNKRAYGAGDSDFEGQAVNNSVNNFAYHISLVSPEDGRGDTATHSGYTEEQYKTLAWLTARTGVANERITTHQHVDNSGTRTDPRSFDNSKFLNYLNQFERTASIDFGF